MVLHALSTDAEVRAWNNVRDGCYFKVRLAGDLWVTAFQVAGSRPACPIKPALPSSARQFARDEKDDAGALQVR